MNSLGYDTALPRRRLFRFDISVNIRRLSAAEPPPTAYGGISLPVTEMCVHQRKKSLAVQKPPNVQYFWTYIVEGIYYYNICQKVLNVNVWIMS